MGKIVALLTDFGFKDHFVGVIKGVIKSFDASVDIIDIAHDIAAGDIWSGAFLLKNAYSYFPRGTVFCVVVDPTVGSERRVIVVLTGKYVFVGPDNGVMSLAAARGDI